MKTIKEIADFCGMSKTSVNRAIEELKIEKTLSGNKNLVADEDAERIVSLLRGFGKTWEEIKTNQNITEQNQNNSTQNQPNSTQNQQNNNQNPSFSQDSVFSVSEKNDSQLINFLLEQIKIKDKEIESLHEENKMLIQSNAYTLKQLEDIKQIQVKEDKNNVEIVPDEPKENAEPQEKKRKFLFWSF